MRKVLASILVLICFIILFVSYLQWKEKINSAKGMEPSLKEEVEVDSSSVDEDEANVVKPEVDVERLLLLTSNQDEVVQDVFRNRLEADEVVDFLIVGSEAMNYGEPGYAERLRLALEESYGDSVNVSTIIIDGATNLFINEVGDLIDFDAGYDVVLFEPLTMKSSGVVVVETQHEHIEMFINRVKDEVEDAVVVLHPAHMLRRATNYPIWVQSVKSFADTNTIPYIDHWTEWPEINSDELATFLDEDNWPTSDGAEVWANALITYFIAE